MRSSSAPRTRRGGSPTRAVHSISSVPTSPRQDRAARMRGYLISMTIRTVCFVFAGIVAVVGGPTWLAWVCVVAAVLLPYPAVVMANNVDHRSGTYDRETPQPYLGVGPASDPRDRPAAASRVSGPDDPWDLDGPAAEPWAGGGSIWRG